MGKKKKKNGANRGKAGEEKKGVKGAPEQNKIFRPTRLISLLFSIMTVVLAVLSIQHNENWFYRIGTQASLGLLMLTNGIEAILNEKKRTLGAILMGVSALILAVMVFTFYVGKKTHAF